jgi:quercetin dioxygenase-like cupin family protein
MKGGTEDRSQEKGAPLKGSAKEQEERDIMSNSFVNVPANEMPASEMPPSEMPSDRKAKSVFIMGDRVERRARLTGTWLNVFEVTVPQGSGAPQHRHASPEVFRILEGQLTIRRMTETGVEEFEAVAGDIVTIAANVAHGYSNHGTIPAVFSAISDRDMADFIAVAGSSEATKSAPSKETIERMLDVANAHGITILAA